MPGPTGDQVEAPEEFPDSAWEEPTDGSLTPEQLAARISVKREEAAQDAGWLEPPQPDAEIEDVVEVEEPPAEEEEEEESSEDTEAEEDAEEEGDQPAEEEAESEGEQEPEDEADDEEFYVARYKTREEAEAAYAEKDATIDRAFRELYERTQRLEELEREQQPQEPQPLDVAAWHEWAEQAVSEGQGQAGAMRALTEGGIQGFDIFIGHWVQDPDQAAEAIAFNNDVQRQVADARIQAFVEPLFQQRQEEDSRAEAERARAEVAKQYEDFEQYKSEMDRVVQEPGVLSEQTKQWLADKVREDGFEGKKIAWEFLYMAAVRNGAPKRAKAQQTEKKRRRASADRAKVEATVSSSEATATRTPLTEAELRVIQKKNSIRKELGQPLLSED